MERNNSVTNFVDSLLDRIENRSIVGMDGIEKYSTTVFLE